MWIFKTLQIINLASFENQILNFIPEQVRLINGENKDDEGQESNGAGKSIITEALSLSLTGNLIRKDILIVDLIRDGSEFSELILELWNSKYQMSLKIYRKFYIKKTSELIIEINGEEEKFASLTDTQKRIYELLDISKDDLLNYFIVSKDRFKPFFNVSDVEKKKIIARFSGGDLLIGIDNLVLTDLGKLDIEFTELEKQEATLQGSITLLKNNIENTPSIADLQEIKKENIQKLTKELEQYKINKEHNQREQAKVKEQLKENEVLREAQESICSNYKEFPQLKELEEIEGDKIELSKLNSNCTININKIKLIIKALEVDKASIEKELLDVIECPNCKFAFSFKDKNFNIIEAKEILVTIQSELEKEIKKISEIEEEIKNIQNLDLTLNEQKLLLLEQQKVFKDLKKVADDKFDKLLKDSKTFNNSIYDYDLKIKSLDNMINNTEKNLLAAINEEIISPNISHLKKQLQQTEIELEEIQKQIQLKKDEYFEIEQWIIIFKKFNSYLANQAIKSIEGFTNYFLTKMETNLAIELEGYSLLADKKTIREEISVNVIRDNISSKFGRYSQGEKVRITIANILAQQKLINLSSKSGGLDYLNLDEIVESLDSKGVNSLLKALNNINQIIDIITHTKVGNFQNQLLIVKENKISTIYDNISN